MFDPHCIGPFIGGMAVGAIIVVAFFAVLVLNTADR